MKILQIISLYNPVANYMLEFLSQHKMIKNCLRHISPSARFLRGKLQGIFI